jgi:hypothetical protein
VAGVPNPALSSLYTVCRAGAYAQRGETALRLGFADRRFRHIFRTLQSALVLRAEAFRIRWVSSLNHVTSR